MLKVLFLSGAAVCGLIVINAQDAVRGPVLGLSYEASSHSIRALKGIPGAATLGEPIFPDLALSKAWLAPGGGYALGETHGDQPVAVIPVGSDTPGSIPVRAGASLVAFSAAGKAAAFYFEDKRQVAIVRGLPGDAVVTEADASTLPGEVRSIAIADDGEFLLAGVREAGTGSVYRLNSRGVWLYLLQADNPGAIVLWNRDRDAAVADWEAGRVDWVKNVAGELSTEVIVQQQPEDKVETSLAVSRDGMKLVIATSDGRIQTVAPAASENWMLRCDCAPSGLTRLAGNAVFQIGKDRGGIPLLFDGDAEPPRIVFVPPPGGSPPPAVPDNGEVQEQ